jgi:hypothetical protein
MPVKYMISWFERRQGSPAEHRMPRSGYSVRVELEAIA